MYFGNPSIKAHYFQKKTRDYWCLKQYRELHEEAALELRTLDIIWRHRKNLCNLLKKGKGKPKVGKRQRQARARQCLNGANLLLTDLVVCSSGVQPCVNGATSATMLVETCPEEKMRKGRLFWIIQKI